MAYANNLSRLDWIPSGSNFNPIGSDLNPIGSNFNPTVSDLICSFNPTLRKEGGGDEGCLCVGNLIEAGKKTAPNGIHSEPLFSFEINFPFPSAYLLTLLFIGGWRLCWKRIILRQGIY